jgi:hypothetical protein
MSEAHKQKRRRSIYRHESEEPEIVNLLFAQDILQEKGQSGHRHMFPQNCGMFGGLVQALEDTISPMG